MSAGTLSLVEERFCSHFNFQPSERLEFGVWSDVTRKKFVSRLTCNVVFVTEFVMEGRSYCLINIPFLQSNKKAQSFYTNEQWQLL
jgi:hypothetical protein